jgi:hypothetical protein
MVTLMCRWNEPLSVASSTTQPYAFGTYPQLFRIYRKYGKNLRRGDRAQRLRSDDLAMMRGAFRPHPDLQRHINELLTDASSTADADRLTDTASSPKYMALHARVEPDMQNHIFCKENKVIRLKLIFELLESQFPDKPPADKLFIAINRPILEEEGGDPKGPNQIAVENLAVLNSAAKDGLWGGKVKIFEAGMPSVMKHANLSTYPGISGSIVDYFLAIEAVLFVGTPVSTFSTDIVAARFYRGNMENYHYLPTGVELATPQNSTFPPRFNC